MFDKFVIFKIVIFDQFVEFVGGIIQIIIKGIFEKNFFIVQGVGGYNIIIIFKNRLYFVVYGKFDWFGVDDGICKFFFEIFV